MLCNLNLIAQAQTLHVIKGKVLDADTEKPVAWANISLKGQAKGTLTDNEGYFELSLKDTRNAELVFSHIGYQKQVLKISWDTVNTNYTVYLTPKQELLKNVVITASLYGQSKNKLAKQVEIIHHREIKDNFHSNVIDVLSSTMGFTKVWEYHSPIILRGLNAKRLLVMKNGNRRIGTFPGGYFAQDMNIYCIKKIEIIKGPGSVIYGNGAISGIVNVISHEPFGKNSTKANFLSGYGSNNNEFLEIATMSHKKPNFGVQANAKYRKTGNMVYGNGETAKNSNVEDRDFSFGTGVQLSSKQTLKINADYHYGNWGKPRGFSGLTKRFTKVRNEEENFHSDLSYSFNPQGVVEKFSVNLYFDNGRRDYYKYKYSEVSGNLTSLDLVHYKDRCGGGRIFSIFNLSNRSKLTVGADGYAFRLDNPADIIDYYNETEGAVSGYKGAGQQDIGAFIRNETQIKERIKIISGMRYDHASVLEGEYHTAEGRLEVRTALSGNLGMVWLLNKEQYLSLNLGRAFRMPTAEEMFTEVISCKGIKRGNPELKPEYSWNIDLGIRGNPTGTQLNYDIALFYNILDGFIGEVQDTTPGVDFTYENTDAVVLGGEMSVSYRFDNVIKAGNVVFAGLGTSYIYGIDKFAGNHAPMFGVPPFTLKFDLNHRGQVNGHWLTGYSVKIQAEYASAQNRVASVPKGTDPGPWGYKPSERHIVFNLAIGLNSNALPGHPKLRFIVKNILDNDYQPFGSYIPAMGRNLKTTLSFTL